MSASHISSQCKSTRSLPHPWVLHSLPRRPTGMLYSNTCVRIYIYWCASVIHRVKSLSCFPCYLIYSSQVMGPDTQDFIQTNFENLSSIWLILFPKIWGIYQSSTEPTFLLGNMGSSCSWKSTDWSRLSMGLNPSQQRYCFAYFSHILFPPLFFSRSLEIMRFFCAQGCVRYRWSDISEKPEERQFK